MNKIKFNIDGKDYSLNIEKLRSMGLIEDEQKKSEKSFHEIEEIYAGDVYEIEFVRVLILECNHDVFEQTYQIAGIDGLKVYADFDCPVSKQKILDFLNSGEYVFVKNINKDVEGLIAV